MQNVDRVKPAYSERIDHSEETQPAIMLATACLGISIKPEHVAHCLFRAEDLIGGGTRFGDQRHRLTDVSGDRSDMRQMPDHVADAWQWLDHSGLHVASRSNPRANHRERVRDRRDANRRAIASKNALFGRHLAAFLRNAKAHEANGF